MDPTPPPAVPRMKSVEEREKKTPSKNVRLESEVVTKQMIRDKAKEVQENMNTNTTNSQSTITASENGEALGPIVDGKAKRRTWGRLSSSLFDTVMMPSLDTTTTEDDMEIM